MRGEAVKAGRYEKKYRVQVDASLLQRARALAQALGFRPDPHGQSGEYRVTSLYFDTADGWCLRASADGARLRVKFRLRVYGQDGPLFVELKGRHGELTLKKRVLWNAGELTLERCRAVFGELAASSQVSPFCLPPTRAAAARLEPSCVVSYLRQAHVGSFDRRVSLDRELKFRAPTLDRRAWFAAGAAEAVPTFGVLELKYPIGQVPSESRCWTTLGGVPVSRFSKFSEGASWLYPGSDYERDRALGLSRVEGGVLPTLSLG
jgi:hypothetical protein